jgi:Zn-dependent protease
MTPLWRYIQTGDPQDLADLLSFLVALVIAITVHEFAHARRAQIAGDPTPEAHGRVTLNPLVHFDIIGTIALLFAGFGWGKPVPVNHMLFRRPRHDSIMVALWGPIANIITATVFAVPLRFGLGGPYTSVLVYIVWLNLVLAFFNLIPIYPLDGSHILVGLLPLEQARQLDLFFHRFGLLLLVLLVMTPAAGIIIGTPLRILFRLLTGHLI